MHQPAPCSTIRRTADISQRLGHFVGIGQRRRIACRQQPDRVTTSIDRRSEAAFGDRLPHPRDRSRSTDILPIGPRHRHRTPPTNSLPVVVPDTPRSRSVVADDADRATGMMRRSGSPTAAHRVETWVHPWTETTKRPSSATFIHERCQTHYPERHPMSQLVIKRQPKGERRCRRRNSPCRAIIHACCHN